MTIGTRFKTRSFLSIAMFFSIMVIAISFMALVASFFPAEVTVVLLDVHGDRLPIKYTDAFRIELVRYPEPGNPDYTSSLGLTPGVKSTDISPGEYDLQIHYSENYSADESMLLYEKKVHLRGGNHSYHEVNLNSVMLYYTVLVAPIDDDYVPPIELKLVIRKADNR